MAEVTEAPAAEATEAPQTSGQPVDESYDESLLIKVKGKVKKPERPDDTEKNMKIAKLKEEIEKASARIAEIKVILDNKLGGGRAATPEQQAIRNRQQELRSSFSELVMQKKRLQSVRDDHQTEREKAQAECRSIRDSIRGPINLEQLDQRIAELEFKLTHESVSATEEKRMREQKERLEKQDRPAALRYSQLQAKVDAAKAAVAEVRAQIAVLDQQLDALKAAQDEQQRKLDAIRARQDEQRSDVPALQVEKNDLWEVIKALRSKQTEIRAEFDVQWDEFKKRDKAWKGWYAQEKKRRNEQRHKEYEERQAARKARDQEYKPAKYEKEVLMCEQVISYLKKYVVVEDAAATAAKEAAPPPEPGMKLLKKKDDEDDFMFAGSGAKKGKGAKKAAVKEAAKTVDRKTQKLQHTIETMQTFLVLGVALPNTVADAPAALEAVTAKKAEYEAKREKAKTEPEEEEPEEAEEEAEAEEAAAANGDATDEEEEEGKQEAVANGSAASPKKAAGSPKKGPSLPKKGGVGVGLSVNDAGKVLVKLTL